MRLQERRPTRPRVGDCRVPFRLEYSVFADCTPSDVWETFCRIEAWPSWSSVIANTHWTEGEPWRPGSRFHMQILQPLPVTFRPEILECNPPNLVHWIGKSSMVDAEQWFSFEQQADGKTEIKTWQEFSGPGTFMFGESIRQAITNIYADLFRSLKAEAEKAAGK